MIELFRHLLRLVVVFRRWWVTLSANFRRNGRRPPIIVGVRKLEWLPFRVVLNMRKALFGFVTKHACDRQTDGLTGRITTANTALACVASRGRNAGRQTWPGGGPGPYKTDKTSILNQITQTNVNYRKYQLYTCDFNAHYFSWLNFIVRNGRASE